jgi:hypothetical protein
MYNFIFLDEQVLFLWMKLINVIKWLVIYINRDRRQLYNHLYIDNYSLLSIKYSKHKLNSFKSSTSYTRNSQILHTTFVKNSDESLDSKR